MNRLEDIWLRFTDVSAVLAVEHCFTAMGTELFSLEVNKTKKEISKAGFFKAATIEELKQHVSKDLPVVLRLTGRKVLSKKVTTLENESAIETARRAFTNVDVESLYFERQVLEENTVVSAIRKDALQEVLTAYYNMGLTIVDVSLAAFSTFPLLKQFGFEAVQLGYHTFNLQEAEVKTLEDAFTGVVQIADEELNGMEVLPYLTGLLFFVERDALHNEMPVEVMQSSRDWRFKTAYRRVLVVGGIGLLLCLLISFFAFSQYFDKNQQLKSKTAGSVAVAEALVTLQAQVKAKEEFLQHNAGENKRLTEICDKIGASLPKAIALEEMSLFPLQKVLKREQLFEFNTQALELKGVCMRYSAFQLWMDRLNNLPFVEKIEVLGFGETERSAPEKFHLRLILRG